MQANHVHHEVHQVDVFETHVQFSQSRQISSFAYFAYFAVKLFFSDSVFIALHPWLNNFSGRNWSKLLVNARNFAQLGSAGH